ncbi:hypothetical protein [Micromonospora sp. NPDC050695]|uniref:hypothetical protein n=1 Tax=Micromonospora sp. NPDC050695 TaxID=3154938 RepID=UPI0033D213A6
MASAKARRVQPLRPSGQATDAGRVLTARWMHPNTAALVSGVSTGHAPPTRALHRNIVDLMRMTDQVQRPTRL